MIIEKPKFVYTGEKEDYSVKWFNTSVEGKRAKLNSNGDFIFNIVIKDYGRMTVEFRTPLDAIEYAKKRIWVKTLPNQRKYAEGMAKIFWIDEESGKEYLAAIVEKSVKRYYEPVSRFDHSLD